MANAKVTMVAIGNTLKSEIFTMADLAQLHSDALAEWEYCVECSNEEFDEGWFESSEWWQAEAAQTLRDTVQLLDMASGI